MESTKCTFLSYYSLYKSHNKPIWINKITLLYPEHKMGWEKFRVKVTRCLRTINALGFYFLHKSPADKAAREEDVLFFLASPVALSALCASSIFLQMWSPLLSNQGDMMAQRKILHLELILLHLHGCKLSFTANEEEYIFFAASEIPSGTSRQAWGELNFLSSVGVQGRI